MIGQGQLLHGQEYNQTKFRPVMPEFEGRNEDSDDYEPLKIDLKPTQVDLDSGYPSRSMER